MSVSAMASSSEQADDGPPRGLAIADPPSNAHPRSSSKGKSRKRKKIADSDLEALTRNERSLVESVSEKRKRFTPTHVPIHAKCKLCSNTYKDIQRHAFTQHICIPDGHDRLFTKTTDHRRNAKCSKCKIAHISPLVREKLHQPAILPRTWETFLQEWEHYAGYFTNDKPRDEADMRLFSAFEDDMRELNLPLVKIQDLPARLTVQRIESCYPRCSPLLRAIAILGRPWPFILSQHFPEHDEAELQILLDNELLFAGNLADKPELDGFHLPEEMYRQAKRILDGSSLPEREQAWTLAFEGLSRSSSETAGIKTGHPIVEKRAFHLCDALFQYMNTLVEAHGIELTADSVKEFIERMIPASKPETEESLRGRLQNMAFHQIYYSYRTGVDTMITSMNSLEIDEHRETKQDKHLTRMIMDALKILWKNMPVIEGLRNVSKALQSGKYVWKHLLHLLKVEKQARNMKEKEQHEFSTYAAMLSVFIASKMVFWGRLLVDAEYRQRHDQLENRHVLPSISLLVQHNGRSWDKLAPDHPALFADLKSVSFESSEEDKRKFGQRRIREAAAFAEVAETYLKESHERDQKHPLQELAFWWAVNCKGKVAALQDPPDYEAAIRNHTHCAYFEARYFKGPENKERADTLRHLADAYYRCSRAYIGSAEMAQRLIAPQYLEKAQESIEESCRIFIARGVETKDKDFVQARRLQEDISKYVELQSGTK